MRNILALSLTILALQSSAVEMQLKPAQVPMEYRETRLDLEFDVFGVSYHTNRDYDFNEFNYGLGVNLALSSPRYDHIYMVASAGTYRDSYDNNATFAVAGPRVLFGWRDEFHVTASVQAGYVYGSGYKGVGMIPAVSFGYDWFDVCFTGKPFEQEDDRAPDKSRMVAMFLKFRAFEF